MSTYELVVKGRVQGSLLHALEGFSVVPSAPKVTCFRGQVADQAALHGVLRAICECDMALTSLRRMDVAAEQEPGS